MQMKRPSVVPMTLLVKAEAKNAFLRLKQNTCEEIGVCNLSVLLQIVQMPLSRLPARSVRCLSATGTRHRDSKSQCPSLSCRSYFSMAGGQRFSQSVHSRAGL